MKLEYYQNEIENYDEFIGSPVDENIRNANINIDGVRLIYDGNYHYVFRDEIKVCFGPIDIGSQVIFASDWDEEEESWAVTLINRNDENSVKVILSRASIMIALPQK